MDKSFLGSLAASLLTAFFIFILEIIFVVAFTALIYSGELSNQVPRALVFIIAGDAILCALVAAASSNPSAIAVEQDASGAMLSVLAAGVIAPLSGAPDRQFATVTMMIVTTTLLTGLILILLGIFRLGGLARFLPYPVIGGFLAGSGWLLLQGGVTVMSGVSSISELLQRSALQLWIPGVLLGALIYVAAQKIRRPYTIPALMLLVSLLFYVVAWAMDLSMDQLRGGGWLLDSSLSMGSWEFALSPALLSQVDWRILLDQLPALIPIAIITVVGLLLNASGMELIIRKEIDLNRELVSAGAGNVAAGLFGGLVGFPDISFSALNHASGGRRLIGILAALLIAATLFIGTSAILYIPKFVFGAVLIYLGIELLMEWVYQAWFRFSRVDFLVIVAILVTLAVRGILEGVIAGLILAVFTFVVSYSRVSVIKFAFTGREYHSRVTRAPDEQQVLQTHGDELYMMRLEGFIFFGTANGIFERLRERVRSLPTEKVRYSLLDFSKVTGIDSTGMLSFDRMMQWSQEQGITLVFTGQGKQLEKQFTRENPSLVADGMLRFFADADHGMEWCENEIIAAYLPERQAQKDISEQLRAILSGGNVEKLLSYLQRREYRPGEYLIEEGDAADFIYFVQSGQVTAQLESPGKPPVRLETITSGRTVGEIAFFLGTRRTASVVADLHSIVYSLCMDDLNRMEASDPEAAHLFHRLSVILLSQRVMHLTYTVRALERS